jgi:glutamate racemase
MITRFTKHIYIALLLCLLFDNSGWTGTQNNEELSRFQQANNSAECKGYKDSKQESAYKVATFDSGFGGFFTAKAIEKQARILSQNGYGPFIITHYGDTQNLPYGEKTPEQIAQLTSAGVLTAFREGAKDVYIACNTASTQIDRVKKIIRTENPSYPNHVHSIIDVSVIEVMRIVGRKLKTQDTVVIAVLATPATVLSETYPNFFAKALNTAFKQGEFQKITQPRWLKTSGIIIDSYSYVNELALGPQKKVKIYQLAPANWVEIIENGASDHDKLANVKSDLRMLISQLKLPEPFDVVGEFCTHYPVFDAMIQNELKEMGMIASDAQFVMQGPLMGDLFVKQYLKKKPPKSETAIKTSPTLRVYLSGTNIEATEALVKKIFPDEETPSITRKEFVILP